MNNNWLSNLNLVLEEHRTKTILVAALFCAVILSFSANYTWLNYDSFWLLRTGQDLIENGLSPWIDHYSFTQNGEPIGAPRYIFSSIYYGFVKLFGEQGGAYAMRLSAFLLALGFMLLWMRQINAPAIAYLVGLPILLVALQQRPLIRPEMLSYTLIIIALMFYQRARLEFSWKSILPIAVLMIIWSNYHSSIFGWVIFFGLFADIGCRLLTNRAPVKSWVNWFAMGMIVLACGYLNPDFRHDVFGMMRFQEEWKALIREYEPPVKYFEFAFFYVYVVMALVTLFMSVRQRKVGYVISLIIFLKASTTTSRMISPTAILCVAMFVHLLADFYKTADLAEIPRSAKRIAAGVGVIATSIMLWHSIELAHAFTTKNIRPKTQYPDQMIQYMKNKGINGRLFNEYHLGGYLLYKLAPDSKVYIDGRTGILYPLDFSKQYFEGKKTAAGMADIFREYDVEYAILANEATNARNLAYLDFQLEYSDVDYSLYRNGTGTFESTGRIWAMPYCWDASNTDRLFDEYSKLNDKAYTESYIKPLSQVINEYLGAESPEQFLEYFEVDASTSDPVIRFLAYRAVEEKKYDIATNLMAHLGEWELKDVLLVSFAKYARGEYESALQQQVNAIRNPPKQVEFTDLAFQYVLLKRISQHVRFGEFLEGYLNRLEKSVGKQTFFTPDEPLDIEVFCQFK